MKKDYDDFEEIDFLDYEEEVPNNVEEEEEPPEKEPPKKSKGELIKEIIISAIILLVTFILILLFSPIFNITNIKVEGNKKVDENIIKSEADVNIGQNILRLNKVQMKNNILSVPYVDEAKILRVWPNTILINISEKEPIAKLKLLGSNIFIDEDGYVLEVLTDDEDYEVPLLENIEVSSIIPNRELDADNPELYKKYLEILKNLKNNDMLENITKIKFTDTFILYTVNGDKINMGDTSDINYKVLRLKSILENNTGNLYIDISNVDTWSTSYPIWDDTEEI
ncbi:MAG: FtsQ-type POTRA domain-containing protein [Clostridia bacterium]|nr:FtsQ-type POTRA domain-containing protein [Clostridia bacterium]